MRMKRWSQSGVLDRIFCELQHKRLIAVRIECVSLDRTIIKAHPDAAGAPKKRTSIDRTQPGRLEQQSSYGCRR